MTKNAKENKQLALDYFCKALRETRNLGIDEYNSVVALELIDRKGCKDMIGRPKPDGEYVRVRWSEDPERDDGYYDICVDGDNCFGMLMDVAKWFDKNY